MSLIAPSLNCKAMCTVHVIHAGTDFLGGGGGGAHPPEAFGTIVSYLIILTTKFVKLPILWSRSRHAGLENKFC